MVALRYWETEEEKREAGQEQPPILGWVSVCSRIASATTAASTAATSTGTTSTSSGPGSVQVQAPLAAPWLVPLTDAVSLGLLQQPPLQAFFRTAPAPTPAHVQHHHSPSSVVVQGQVQGQGQGKGQGHGQVQVPLLLACPLCGDALPPPMTAQERDSHVEICMAAYS